MSDALSKILLLLAEDLTRERLLGDQVVTYLADHHQAGEAQLPQFFETTLPTLEDDAVDLAFSPLFTPTLADRARYMPLLGETTLSDEDLHQFVAALAQKNLRVPLVTGVGQHLEMPLPEVMLHRYVTRLFLNRPIAPGAYGAIQQCVPVEDHPVACVLARESVWQKPDRARLLEKFLTTFSRRGSYSLEKLQYLTDFFRTYRPANPEQLREQLQRMIESCQSDLARVCGRSFHDTQLKDKYVVREEGNHGPEHEAQASVTYLRLMTLARALQADLDDEPAVLAV